MPPFEQSILLSFVQGLTEFIPVSSSGHLGLIQHILGTEPSLAFAVFLNTATLMSVLFFFRKKTTEFLKMLPFIIVGSLPISFFGFLFNDQLEDLFSNLFILPFFFLITTALVFSVKFLRRQDNSLNYQKALIIGLFQSLAIMPGVSRSATTIFSGLLLGLSPITAFTYSFFLFIPASIGALFLSLPEISGLKFDFNTITSFLISFLVGLIALKILRQSLLSKKFWMFGFYTFLMAVISFLII